MANQKLALTIGEDAEGNLKCLYIGREPEKALEFLDDQPRGIVKLAVFKNPIPWRRRTTEEAILVENKRREDAEKRSAEARAAREKEIAAKIAAEKAEIDAANARAQADAAREEKNANAKKLSEQADTLERIAKDARSKAEKATKAIESAAPTPVDGHPPGVVSPLPVRKDPEHPARTPRAARKRAARTNQEK